MSPSLLQPKRSEADLSLRNHQIRRQVWLEQQSARYERLSIELTDPEGRAEALKLSVELAARANRIRTAVALTNMLVPEGADEQARRLEREAEA